MVYQEYKQKSGWQSYVGVLPASYRVLAFAIAGGQIFFFPDTYESIIPSTLVVSAIGAYSLIKVLYPLRWYMRDILSRSVLGTDVLICLFLVLSTGGLHSPFLPYSLAPVLTAALVASKRVTFSVAGLSVVSIFAAHLANPLIITPLPLELENFFLYAIAVSLTAMLPYLINANLKQHLQSQNVLQERQRLSHEIHDGSVQTLASLRWLAQIIRSRLAEREIVLDEVSQMERLADKAYHETRESLELLRDCSGNGSLLPKFQGYLKHLSEDRDIDLHLDVEMDKLQLAANVQLELLRICQEAMTNVKKHSQAQHVEVKVKPIANALQVSIADDGCGFDAVAFYHDGVEAKGHGLAIMRERADSIGGRFRVVSMQGRGTEIQVEVPSTSRQGMWLWNKQ